jgi:MHS family proline/betaine transporter-like MFS transporter
MLSVALVSWPLYAWLESGGMASVVVANIVFMLMIAVPLGSAPALFVELFPARDRLSGYSVAYNLGLGVVGGATPMVSTWLIDVTGQPTMPAVVMTVMAVVAVGALLSMTDRSREPLR